MKIIICIILLDDNYDNINLIENTWLKIDNLNINYYFFIDKKYKLIENNKYIYLDNLLIDNHFVIINWLNLYKNDYDFVLFTYCESYVNLNNL